MGTGTPSTVGTLAAPPVQKAPSGVVPSTLPIQDRLLGRMLLSIPYAFITVAQEAAGCHSAGAGHTGGSFTTAPQHRGPTLNHASDTAHYTSSAIANFQESLRSH